MAVIDFPNGRECEVTPFWFPAPMRFPERLHSPGIDIVEVVILHFSRPWPAGASLLVTATKSPDLTFETITEEAWEPCYLPPRLADDFRSRQFLVVPVPAAVDLKLEVHVGGQDGFEGSCCLQLKRTDKALSLKAVDGAPALFVYEATAVDSKAIAKARNQRIGFKPGKEDIVLARYEPCLLEGAEHLSGIYTYARVKEMAVRESKIFVEPESRRRQVDENIPIELEITNLLDQMSYRAFPPVPASSSSGRDIGYRDLLYHPPLWHIPRDIYAGYSQGKSEIQAFSDDAIARAGLMAETDAAIRPLNHTYFEGSSLRVEIDSLNVGDIIVFRPLRNGHVFTVEGRKKPNGDTSATPEDFVEAISFDYTDSDLFPSDFILLETSRSYDLVQISPDGEPVSEEASKPREAYGLLNWEKHPDAGSRIQDRLRDLMHRASVLEETVAAILRRFPCIDIFDDEIIAASPMRALTLGAVYLTLNDMIDRLVAGDEEAMPARENYDNTDFSATSPLISRLFLLTSLKNGDLFHRFVEDQTASSDRPSGNPTPLSRGTLYSAALTLLTGDRGLDDYHVETWWDSADQDEVGVLAWLLLHSEDEVDIDCARLIVEAKVYLTPRDLPRRRAVLAPLHDGRFDRWRTELAKDDVKFLALLALVLQMEREGSAVSLSNSSDNATAGKADLTRLLARERQSLEGIARRRKPVALTRFVAYCQMLELDLLVEEFDSLPPTTIAPSGLLEDFFAQSSELIRASLKRLSVGSETNSNDGSLKPRHPALRALLRLMDDAVPGSFAFQESRGDQDQPLPDKRRPGVTPTERKMDANDRRRVEGNLERLRDLFDRLSIDEREDLFDPTITEATQLGPEHVQYFRETLVSAARTAYVEVRTAYEQAVVFLNRQTGADGDHTETHSRLVELQDRYADIDWHHLRTLQQLDDWQTKNIIERFDVILQAYKAAKAFLKELG